MAGTGRTTFRHILAVMLVPMILVFGITFLAVENIIYRLGTRSERETVALLAAQVSGSVETVFRSIAHQLELAGRNAANIVGSNGLQALTSVRFLRSFLDSNPDVYCAWFALEPGEFSGGKRASRSFARRDGVLVQVYNVNEAALDDPGQTPWYHIPRSTGEPYFDAGRYVDFGDGIGPLYTGLLSSPMFFEGKFIGCIGANIRYPSLMKFMDVWQEPGRRNVMLLGEDGRVLYTAVDGVLGGLLGDLGFDAPKLEKISEGLDRDAFFMGEMHSPFFGKDSLVCVTPVAVSGVTGKLFLYMDIPLDVLLASVNELIRLMSIIVATGLLAFAAGVFAAARSVTGPIRRIAASAEAIAAGNFDLDFDEAVIGRADSEVRAMYGSLHRMVGELRQQNELRLSVVRAELEKRKLIESSEAKSRFLANVSHEIRTPMNAIVGLAELMRSERLGEKQACYARDIKESTEALLEIINDVLDLSKMEAGDIALFNAHYDFRAMLGGLGDEVLGELKSKPLVRFEESVAEDVPDCLFGDMHRLRQLLSNVLSNAVRYTNKGTVGFDVRADDKYIHFVVSDTGIGIASEDIPGLFDPINGLSSANGGFCEGARLGLAITKYLVTAMDGSIKVESEPGRGSVFTITIPRVEGRRELASFDSEGGSFSASGARALIVDDNEVNLNVAAGLISMYGVECDRATSGREAIEMLKRSEYDVVFMDHMMPEMDGVRTTSIIRAQGGRFASLPIVALTANAVIGANEMFLSSGFDDFMSKPISMPRLRAVLLRWIPRDKVTFFSEYGDVCDDAPAYSDVITAAAALAELDAALGLERVAMQQDVYEESLRLVAVKTANLTTALESALAGDDLQSLQIHAHSLKGSLSGVGAMPLSALAAEIEKAAGAGDAAFCKNALPPFIERLTRFADDLRALFPPDEAAASDGIVLELDALRSAIASFDFEGCIERIDRLESSGLEGETAERLGLLRLLVERFEHEPALSLIDDIRREHRD